MIVGSPTILNLVPGGVMKCVHVNQVNKNIEIQFKVMNGAAPYNVPEGVTCTIRGTKGDAFGYAAEAAVTAGSNVITVTLTEQLTAVAGGCNVFELVFVGAENSMKVSTENFILAVERAALGEDTVISDSDLAYAEQVLDQLQSVGAVNAQVQQNKANIAAETTRATAAEQTLQQHINSETSARQSADNTLQSNINAEASTRATQDASLQSQINQLIAPSGSAPSAAEVENARVGADGTVYPTLGDAIRTQVTDVKSALDYCIEGEEIYSTFVQGTRIANAYNAVSSNPNRCTTGKYFAVREGDRFSVTCDTSGVKFAVAGKYASGTTYDSGWKTGTYEITAASDVNLFVNVATSDGNTPITPSDFTATITRTDNTSRLHTAYVSIDANTGALAAEDAVINHNHNLVNYGYDEYFKVDPVPTAVDSTNIGIERTGQIVTLNGDGISKDIVIKLDKPLQRTVNGSTVKTWTKTILLKANHHYKITAQWLSGTITGVEEPKCPTVSVYIGNTSANTIGYGYHTDAGKGYVRIVDGEGALCSVCLYVPANYVSTDTKILVLMEDITYDVTSQYFDEMVDTVEKVRSENTSPALVFPWVTDIHRYKVAAQTFLDMINNIRTFAKAVKCDFILNTGDTIEGDQAQSVSLGYAYDSIAEFKNIGEPFFYSEGNHDNNPYVSSGALVFTLKQVFGGFFSATKGVTFNTNENGTDYYFDFANIGVRFVSLNSCNASVANTYAYGASTAAWLAEALDTSHMVVVATHVSPVSAHVWKNNSPTNRGDIVNALNTFVGNGGKLILLTGHSHVDAEFIDPYVEITDVCQKFEKADTSTEGYGRITGEIDGIRNPDRDVTTYTADAWTVAVLKPIEKMLALIRFGAGVDRYIHCDAIAPTTLTTKLSGTVTWSSSDTAVATVADGVVTGVANGKCAIIAKDAEGNIEVWVIVVP